MSRAAMIGVMAIVSLRMSIPSSVRGMNEELGMRNEEWGSRRLCPTSTFHIPHSSFPIHFPGQRIPAWPMGRSVRLLAAAELPAQVPGLNGRASTLDSQLSTLSSPPRWSGTDETVVKRFAEDAGRTPAEPLLPVDRGDLPLFFFLLAGAIGGFIAGYTFRTLFPPRKAVERQDAART